MNKPVAAVFHRFSEITIWRDLYDGEWHATCWSSADGRECSDFKYAELDGCYERAQEHLKYWHFLEDGMIMALPAY